MLMKNEYRSDDTEGNEPNAVMSGKSLPLFE